MGSRLILGTAGAVAIVIVARKRQSLSRSGAYAALVLGVICAAVGWGWAMLLIGFFISGSLLSAYKSGSKSARMLDVVAKGGERDAWQVLANGGIFAAAAVLSLIEPSPLWLCAGAGAIATSAADTWATEIGVLSGGAPHSIITGKPVSVGESGGVTWLGTFAGAGGALLIAVITWAIGWTSPTAIAAIIGGIGGCVTDSLLGATLQCRRWCDHCSRATERTVHSCGTTTRLAGGLPWMNNDAVNAASSVSGAILGMLFCLLSRL